MPGTNALFWNDPCPITTYADPARALVQGRFAPCETVYLGAEGLPAGTYALEWYAKASPVRGTDSPFRSVDPWTVSGGSGLDQVEMEDEAAVEAVQRALAELGALGLYWWCPLAWWAPRRAPPPRWATSRRWRCA